MARPREFDENDVLEKALDVFWRRGFEATSVQDLVTATGLSRASLYGAFGDKEALYKKVLDRYVEKIYGSEGVLKGARGAREKIERILLAQLGATCSKEGPRGCFLLLSGTAGDETPCTKALLEKAQTHSERLLETIIREGQEAGELGRKADPKTLARFLQVLASGVASSARAGWSRDRLKPVLAEAVDHVARS